jgi:DNA sulfur modification protein DndD
MPKKIRQYFYFDGEQLDSYFISDESFKIKETIHAISQVDVVTQVKERLQKVIVSKQNEAGKKAPNIKTINDEIAQTESEINNVLHQIRELETQIETSKRIIAENTEHLSGQENLPDLESKFQQLNNRRSTLLEKKEQCNRELFVFVREMKIALSLYPAAKNTLAIIEEKESQNALPPDIDKKLLENILTQHTCLVCGQKLKQCDEDHIHQLIDQIQVSSETSNLLMLIRSELERSVAAAQKYKVQKAQLLGKLKSITDELEQCEQELQGIDDQISKFSDKVQVIQWHNERKQHSKLLEINQGQLSVQKYCLEDAYKRKEIAENKLKRELSRVKECERINQLVEFLSDSQNIVKIIETEMMEEVKDKMEHRTMDFFLKLIWKKGVYDHITLDSKYQLDLIHRDGYSCVGSCSAAERSLLALSFTLALHEVSGFNALLFIDTPVARVSSQNRVNFANVLQQVSTQKQLIMTFTPDEYSESIRKVFMPVASTSVHLTMNSDNEITNIER